MGRDQGSREGGKGRRDKRVLDGVPPGPALARAQKIGQRCGKVGFDWPGWEGSFAKVEEEVREVRDAIGAQRSATTMHAELGDLLLACVNLARKVGVDAENALLDATRAVRAALRDRRGSARRARQDARTSRTSRRWMRCGTMRSTMLRERKVTLFCAAAIEWTRFSTRSALHRRDRSTAYPQNRWVLPRVFRTSSRTAA